MFHLLANNIAALNSAAFTAATGVPDAEFSRQAGNSFVFSEQYNLLAAFARGATLADCRLNVPSVNQVARHHIFSLNDAATVPSNPQVHETFDTPIALPTYEQIIVEATNSAAGAENTDILMWIAPQGGFNRNIPAGQRLVITGTATTTGTTASVWNGLVPIIFNENLKSGWYSVVGAMCIRAGSEAFRIVFAKAPMNGSRKMRPGGLCIQAQGNLPYWRQMQGGFGVWGRFHSQEPPQFEAYQTTGAAVAHLLWLDVVYEGQGSP